MAEPRGTRLRRWALGCLFGLVGLVVMVVLLVGGGIAWLGTAGGNRWLARQIERQVEGRMCEGDLRIGGLDTNVIGGLVLSDVALVDGAGDVVFGAERIAIRYDVWPFLSRRAQIDRLIVDGGVIDLEADANGVLDLQRAFCTTEPPPESDAPWAGLPIDFDADEIRLQGLRVRYRTPTSEVRLVGVDLVGQAHGSERRIELVDVVGDALVLEPVALPVMLRGGIAYTGDGLELDDLIVLAPGGRVAGEGTIAGLGSDAATYDLSLDLSPLDLDLFQRMTGMKQDLRGVVEGKLELEGPAEALRVRGQLQGVGETRGAATVDVTLDSAAEGLPWKGTIEAEGLRVEDFYEIGETGIELTGRLTAEGKGTSYPDDLGVTGRYEGAVRIERPDQVIAFDRIAGDLALRQGELAFRDVESEGPLGRIGATGTLDLQSGELVVDAKGLVDLMGLEALGFDDILGGADVVARVSGNVLAEELDLEANGTATIAPFEYGEDIRFQRATASFDWWLRGDTQHVDAHVVATNGVVYDAEIERLETQVAVHLPPSRQILVEGTASVDELDYGAIFDARTASGEYAVTVPADREAPVDVTARFDVGAHQLFDEFPGAGGTVRIGLADDVLAYDVDLQATYGPLLDVTGTYGVDDRRVALTELLFAPTPRQAWRGDGVQTFTVTDGGIADARIAVGSPLGLVSIEGTLGTEGPLDAEVRVEALQLDLFAELFPEDLSGLSGALDLEAGLEGTAEAPRIAGIVDARGVWVPGVSRWLDVDGAFEADRRQVDLAIAIGAAGEPLAIVDGVIPVDLDLSDPQLDPDGRIDLALVLEPGDLARIENLLEQDLGLPPGRLSAVLAVEGILRDPNFGLTGVLEADVEGWGQRGRVEFDVDRVGDRLDFWATVREGYDSRGLVSGEGETRLGDIVAYALGDAPEPDWDDWTLYLDDLEARVAVLGTPVESLLALAGDPFVAEGELLGGFVVQGSPLEPVVTGAVNWVQASIGGVDLPGAYFALIPSGTGYDLDVALQFADPEPVEQDGEEVASEEPTGDLQVSGHIPLRIDLREDPQAWTTGELALTVSGTGIPLDLFSAFDAGIVEAEGLLVVEGTIGGDPLDPRPDLVFALVDGSVAYSPLGVRFVDIDLGAEATASRLQLHNLSAQTEPIQDVSFQAVRDVFGAQPGKIVARGSARLEEWTPRAVNFRAELDQALLSYRLDQVFRLSTPTALTAQGDWPALQIGGELRVDQGLFVYEAAEFLSASPFELHSDLVVHRTTLPGEEESEPEEEAEPEPPLYANFDVDVRIDLNRSMEVRAELPFIDDYGAIGAAVSTADVVARLGSRNLRVEMRGGELVLLNEVEIVDGQVGIFRALFDISGGNLVFLGDPSNPLIDIVAEMTVSDGVVTVLIQGTPDAPEIQFRSDQYPDQTEIFTILLTGKSPEQLSNTEGASTFADASALLLNSVLGQARTHSITVDPDGRIRGNIPIPNRDVRAQFTLDPLPAPDENWYAISAEVSLFRQIMLEAAWGSEHSWGEVFWEHRF